MRLILKAFSFLAWPMIIGLLAGLATVISQPSLRYVLGEQVRDFFLPPSQSARSYAAAVQSAAPAVVTIFTRKKVEQTRNPLFDDRSFRNLFNSADTPPDERQFNELGSGVIINNEGYLLTNNHVIANAREIVVALYDGRKSKAVIVGSDPGSDLAVLKIPLGNLKSITLGEPQKARVGDVVLAIGNPLSVGQTVTQGIISATGRYFGLNQYENFLQTDAAINPGNSGGALIDTNGKLLGINTAIVNDKKSGSRIGISLAIPADIAVNVMNDIITSGEVIRGWLGIEGSPITESIQQKYKLPNNNGVIITGTKGLQIKRE